MEHIVSDGWTSAEDHILLVLPLPSLQHYPVDARKRIFSDSHATWMERLTAHALEIKHNLLMCVLIVNPLIKWHRARSLIYKIGMNFSTART